MTEDNSNKIITLPLDTPEMRAFMGARGENAEIETYSSGPHHQDSGEAKIRESTAGVSRKPSSEGKAR